MFFIVKFALGRNHGKRKVAEKANGNQENVPTAGGEATTAVAASAEYHEKISKESPENVGVGCTSRV